MSETNSPLKERIRKYYSKILNGSEDPIFIQISDTEFLSNLKFANFLGFNSIEEFEENDKKFPEEYITESTVSDITTAYREACEHYAGSLSNITWIKSDEATVRTDVITAPFPFEEKIVAFNDLILIYQEYK